MMAYASNTNRFYLHCRYFNINYKVNIAIVFGLYNNQIEIQEILPNASSPTLPPKTILFYQDLENKHLPAINNEDKKMVLCGHEANQTKFQPLTVFPAKFGYNVYNVIDDTWILKENTKKLRVEGDGRCLFITEKNEIIIYSVAHFQNPHTILRYSIESQISVNGNNYNGNNNNNNSNYNNDNTECKGYGYHGMCLIDFKHYKLKKSMWCS